MHFRQWKRRESITLMGSASAAWPLAARAQQAAQVARIGFLSPAPDNALFAQSYAVFLDELRKLGFTEGHNLTIDHRREMKERPKPSRARPS
jgi:putative tryptophan/tyrosine transport system substrate-binding protein